MATPYMVRLAAGLICQIRLDTIDQLPYIIRLLEGPTRTRIPISNVKIIATNEKKRIPSYHQPTQTHPDVDVSSTFALSCKIRVDSVSVLGDCKFCTKKKNKRLGDPEHLLLHMFFGGPALEVSTINGVHSHLNPGRCENEAKLSTR